MFEQLSKNEREALDLVKESYDKTKSTSITTIQPKLTIKIKENVMESLQQKGFWTVEKKDLNNMEMVSITLKVDFFKYYNIPMC